MADSPALEQINKLEGLNMAISAPVNDAMSTLLNEGRQGAYAISGTVDTSNPKSVELTSGLTERNAQGLVAHPEQVLHGLESTTLDLSGADSGIAKVGSSMAFVDDKGEPVRIDSSLQSTNAKDNSLTRHFKDTDAAGKTTLEGLGFGLINLGADTSRSITIEELVDANGKKHTALDIEVSAPGNTKVASDTFVFKDGITPQQAMEQSIAVPSNIIGVIHSDVSTNGDKSTFNVEIQPSRAIAVPNLDFGANK